jgi:hypothetical protein
LPQCGHTILGLGLPLFELGFTLGLFLFELGLPLLCAGLPFIVLDCLRIDSLLRCFPFAGLGLFLCANELANDILAALFGPYSSTCVLPFLLDGTPGIPPFNPFSGFRLSQDVDATMFRSLENESANEISSLLL